ncbi:glycoside hydrolase family 15 protein [Larsenimonas suaedae]|uniref:Glycoside hydrolase family 15 protein n=1 Tax=Larsenimonas suaedae TaxID=1851019 RepID=A0ABU1GW63_9GAMM|nr:glycoside hydrolase family 15 protein [Larsenimonas suaedae]MCM2973351.1 glycoside hydrolase family 15 protein [Larsenimonas suaedae]MDR5896244.1 glycoside hydrolase family 15 protein [Larsenimonas suaedae]
MTLTRTVTNPERERGYSPLENYAAIGEGRSVALVNMDGAIDWWCAPTMDRSPLFDRLLDAEHGGHFVLTPRGPYRAERRYRHNSNVLETTFITENGSARVTESINSNTAGRLPWCELARRVDGVEGEVEFDIQFVPGTQVQTVSPWLQTTTLGEVYNIGPLMVMVRHSDDVHVTEASDRALTACLTAREGVRSMVALLAAEGEPLAVPSIDKIDERIDVSDFAWRDWAEKLDYDGDYKQCVLRSALALKFLLYSPSGAIAAAATTSLPEGIGGEKNYDYRYAWVRDACLVIKAFVHAGALEECKAAFSWLTATIHRHGPNMRACYTLEGGLVPAERYPELEGYMGSRPVRVGNNAKDQLQTSMYGDMLATASLFIEAGHVIDIATARLLGDLANQCADRWQQKDCGIWELPETHHYTHSKMACWLALDHAVRLADDGHIEPTWKARWQRERDRIAEWVEANCWSPARQAYVFYPGTEKLDAAMCLTHRFGTGVNPERMALTYRAIREELGSGALLHRYSGAAQEEGAFLACSFWMVEALGATGDCEEAHKLMQGVTELSNNNLGLMHEMIDPDSGRALGNFPQGLSHLALICAANVLSGGKSESTD